MSNVRLSLGGRNFTVACAEGEEAHVTELGHMIDAKLSTMGDAAGLNEPRMLLFAALLLADELHETKSSESPEAAPESVDSQDVLAPVLSPSAAQQLDSIASRLENLADLLEGADTNA